MTTVAPTTAPTTVSDDEEGKENYHFGADAPLQVGSPPKRLLDEMQGDDSLETPPRQTKKWKQDDVGEDEGDGDWQGWEPPTRRSKEAC